MLKKRFHIHYFYQINLEKNPEPKTQTKKQPEKMLLHTNLLLLQPRRQNNKNWLVEGILPKPHIQQLPTSKKRFTSTTTTKQTPKNKANQKQNPVHNLTENLFTETTFNNNQKEKANNLQGYRRFPLIHSICQLSTMYLYRLWFTVRSLFLLSCLLITSDRSTHNKLKAWLSKKKLSVRPQANL